MNCDNTLVTGRQLHPASRAVHITRLLCVDMHTNQPTHARTHTRTHTHAHTHAHRSLASALHGSARPVAVLDLRLPRSAVDVNVVPDKRTVMMQCEQEVVHALEQVRCGGSERGAR